MASSGNWWTRLKTFGVEEPPPEPTLLSQFEEATTLTRTQRLYGFGICIGLALFFFFLSGLFWVAVTKFAILYTFGNLFALGSTMFLMGPVKQIKQMFDQGRWIASTVFIVAMLLTLVAAMKLHSLILALICIFFQFGALVWYCLSYIPFARQVASNMVRSGMGV